MGQLECNCMDIFHTMKDILSKDFQTGLNICVKIGEYFLPEIDLEYIF